MELVTQFPVVAEEVAKLVQNSQTAQRNAADALEDSMSSIMRYFRITALVVGLVDVIQILETRRNDDESRPEEDQTE